MREVAFFRTSGGVSRFLSDFEQKVKMKPKCNPSSELVLMYGFSYAGNDILDRSPDRIFRKIMDRMTP